MKLITALSTVALVLTGCETSSINTPLPEDHPASVHAEPSRLPGPSSVLDNAGPLPQSVNHGTPEGGSHDHGQNPSPSATTPSGTHPTKPVEAAGFECPMHPEVTSSQASRCPKCGMKLTKAEQSSKGGDGHDGH